MRPRRVPLVLAVLAALAPAALTGCTAAAPVPPPSPTPAFSWPAVPGQRLSSTTTAEEQKVRVRVADPEAAYARARSLLVDAGYVLTKDRRGTGGGDGQACSPDTLVCVGFTAGDDPDAGPSVLYEVFRSTGITG